MSNPMRTKTIAGLAVSCASLEPADAYDLLPELAPVLGALFTGRDGLKAGSEEAVASALQAASKALGGGKITEIMIRLMATTVVTLPSEAGGNKIRITDRGSFNLAFAGRLWAAFPVAAFAFEVTYGNFSDAVALALGGSPQPSAAP